MSRKAAVCRVAAGLVAIGLALIGTRALAQAEASGPLEIRVVHGTPLSMLIASMPAKKDILPNYGKAYMISLRQINASSEVATALAGGATDLGTTSTGALISVNTKLNANLRVVADMIQNGVKGHNAHWYSVRADDPIKNIRDLKGRTVATLGFGSFADLSMRVAMKKAGIDPAKDVTVVQVPFLAMEASLREKKVDLVFFVPPFYQIARAKGGIRVLFTTAETFGPVQALFLAARGDFLQKNPRRVQAFFDDYYRFLQYGLDPKNRDEMVEIAAKMQNVPPAGAKRWWNTQEDFYRAPDGLPLIEGMKKEMRLLNEFGILDTAVDIDRWVDLSFMKAAAANYRR
ncbi:MAG: ABC transporter substrate-binding protein [Betaproteobacteria bacterium]|nr:ABC transporter substrate-binding protein [Betaproteobacteria bacterium]